MFSKKMSPKDQPRRKDVSTITREPETNQNTHCIRRMKSKKKQINKNNANYIHMI